ncbi:MAG TPA: hypothetical protein VK796_10265, partial [Cytophaga sp.]|nr:hypothetical protein [Cytophaga sp.]
LIYTQYATLDSGYALSNILLPETIKEYENLLQEEFINNCQEKEFTFIKQSIWSIGLMASRHYRTYVFPYYWRQFLKLKSETVPS